MEGAGGQIIRLMEVAKPSKAQRIPKAMRCCFVFVQNWVIGSSMSEVILEQGCSPLVGSRLKTQSSSSAPQAKTILFMSKPGVD